MNFKDIGKKDRTIKAKLKAFKKIKILINILYIMVSFKVLFNYFYSKISGSKEVKNARLIK